MDTTPKYVDQRSRVMLGMLPEDFLRIDPAADNVAPNTPQCAAQGQHPNYARPNMTTQITICIVQAQLVKNYSLTKMDPYARIRIGHTVFETHSDLRAGKSPSWNKTITAHLPPGIKTIHIEIYDEKTLTPDERVAYADYVIPDEALQGKFLDTWIPLSGKQGSENEGSINITIYIRSVPVWSNVVPSAPVMVVQQPSIGFMPYYLPSQPVTVHPGFVGQPVMQSPYPYPMQPPQVQPYAPTEEDIKQMLEMFPSYDREVVASVLESVRGNKDQTISKLLAMSDK